MSYRQKQENMKFIRKSGGLLEKSSPTEKSVNTTEKSVNTTEKSVLGKSNPSNNAPPSFDQPVAYNLSENAGSRLGSLDKKLASSILEASLPRKIFSTYTCISCSEDRPNFYCSHERRMGRWSWCEDFYCLCRLLGGVDGWSIFLAVVHWWIFKANEHSSHTSISQSSVVTKVPML